jgi:pimeloyl-ACP methyl ester carboxylesterase
MLIALPTPYRERNFVFEAHGCRLDTAVIESKTGEPKGTVLLLHGLAANKKIMAYSARAFAAMDLRVVVADLPGHGQTPGPFSPARAEQCSANLLQDLFARGMARPESTIVAGHSMGAALALRMAEKQPVAGLVAVSPAPMVAAHGVPAEALLFAGAPLNPRNALVLNGQFEPETMRGNSADLVSAGAANGSKYEVVPGATHVSLLFDPRVVLMSQQWVARVLQIDANAGLPSRWPLLASIAGFAGILLIAGPFLRELTRDTASTAKKVDLAPPRIWMGLLLVGVAGLCSVGILHWWNPLRALHIFEGDYLAAFILLVSMALLAATRSLAKASFGVSMKALVSAVAGGILLLLLVTGWFELTLSEAWLNSARWARFPFFLAAVLPYHFAEEMFLGPIEKLSGWRRLGAGLTFRLVPWLTILIGLWYLHSGEILLMLLAPYFLLLCILQRRGMDIVRMGTESATAAAVFGAILLAGFCLVIFPIT